MNDQEREAFYNRLAHEMTQSTVDAIADLVEQGLSGQPCSPSLRASIAEIVPDLFSKFNNRYGGYQQVKQTTAADVQQLCAEATARICDAVSDDIGKPTEIVVEKIGVSCLDEAFRALKNLNEALGAFARDWLIDPLNLQNPSEQERTRLKAAGIDPGSWHKRS
jgi:hypothetical protein